MALTEETKRGITGNLNTAMMQTIHTMELIDPKNSRKDPIGLLVKQTAVQTIALVAIAQLLLEQAEVSRVIVPN